MNIKEIIENIGSETLQESLGVSEYSIRAAKRDGRFPSSWWSVVKALGEKRGLEVGEDMFSFKPPASQQDTAA